MGSFLDFALNAALGSLSTRRSRKGVEWKIKRFKLQDLTPRPHALNGDEVSTRCLIAPGGQALLGAVALESLLLAVDPIAKRLIPVKGFVG